MLNKCRKLQVMESIITQLNSQLLNANFGLNQIALTVCGVDVQSYLIEEAVAVHLMNCGYDDIECYIDEGLDCITIHLTFYC